MWNPMTSVEKYQQISMATARCTYEYHHMAPTRPLLSRAPQMMVDTHDRYSPKFNNASRNNYPIQLYYGGHEQFLEEQLECSSNLHNSNQIPLNYPSIPSSGHLPSMVGEHVSWQSKDIPTTNQLQEKSHNSVSHFNTQSSDDHEEEEDDFDDSPKIRSRSGFKKTRKLKGLGTRRVMEKNGTPNIRYKNVSERRRRYIIDFYTTLIDSDWTMTLLLFALSFYITWVTFATIYYFISWIHGDLLPDNLPGGEKQRGGEWKPCILEMLDFASAFLFSLETQHTIGYGSRQTTNECPEAIIVMSFQSVIGCLIQAFMVGLVFAKLSRPKHRANTVVFSKNGIVCERDKQMCMIFRVGDMRHDSFIVGAQISLKLIRRRGTMQGEIFDEISPLKITPSTVDEACLFLIWPLTVIHEIDENSPFYRMSRNDLAVSKFELSLTLEGTIESTSMTFQARTSYLPSEIFWGNRFEPMILFRSEQKKYQVNFSAFHSTYEVETPICSAYELDEYYKARNKESRKFQNMNRSNKPATPPQFHACNPKNLPTLRYPRSENDMKKSQSHLDIQTTIQNANHPPNPTNSSHSHDKTLSESSATSTTSTCPEPNTTAKNAFEQPKFTLHSVSSENVPDI
uniref:ATPsensitive inward rectifier potassium channel 12like [Bombyx mori] n=1 Tax=Lepeophtheirus salmonis TaxID=72036 RepID=A0A0K2U9Y5_LEPSM